MLNTSPESTIVLRCGDVSLMRGRMGRVGNTISIEVDESLKRSDSS